jgi:uncharacterized protein YbcV (DUF1398 family)
MALFGGQRDVLFVNSINKELLQNIIEQQIGYYKINISDTNVNIYGESDTKFYYEPVLLNCLIERGDTTTNNDDLGPDSVRTTTFNIFRQDLIDADLEPEVGDIVVWNNDYYEVDNTNDNQFFLGKSPDYAMTQDTVGFGSSISIGLVTHWTRVEKLNIIKTRI